mmetsp:Transcript_15778/g.40536  ORF Transcript_15778/g.40536 Transcript_15778/m.40536 type:complete len:213 (+) Transcript_15778:786-1424(+)
MLEIVAGIYQSIPDLGWLVWHPTACPSCVRGASALHLRLYSCIVHRFRGAEVRRTRRDYQRTGAQPPLRTNFFHAFFRAPSSLRITPRLPLPNPNASPVVLPLLLPGVLRRSSPPPDGRPFHVGTPRVPAAPPPRGWPAKSPSASRATPPRTPASAASSTRPKTAGSSRSSSKNSANPTTTPSSTSPPTLSAPPPSSQSTPTAASPPSSTAR